MNSAKLGVKKEHPIHLFYTLPVIMISGCVWRIKGRKLILFFAAFAMMYIRKEAFGNAVLILEMEC